MHEEPVSRRLATGLARIAMAMRSQSWARAGRHRLTPTQAQVLQLVAARPGGMRVGDLAEELAVTAQTASDSIAALRRKDLVAKQADPHDRRVARITATERGLAEADQLADWPDAIRAVIDDLDPAEQRLLLGIVVKMIRGLQERGRMPIARVCVTCRFFQPHAHAGTRRPHHCGFVDAAFGDDDLRTDCPDQEPAAPDERAELWRRYLAR